MPVILPGVDETEANNTDKITVLMGYLVLTPSAVVLTVRPLTCSCSISGELLKMPIPRSTKSETGLEPKRLS